MTTQVAVVDPLIERLRDAVLLGEAAAIATRIKKDLEGFIPAAGLVLPDRFRRTKPSAYCRRLLYRDQELGFTAVVMTWAPGQRTALHDHAGIWCVEGVVEGEMEVRRYELLEERGDGLYSFVERGGARARAGNAGALIPPYEHHTLGNATSDRLALTLHVYGGEMDRCSIFEPMGDGLYRRSEKALCYDE